jgi:hypothetical protein
MAARCGWRLDAPPPLFAYRYDFFTAMNEAV